MTKKERALLAVQTLEEVYPQATCALQYEKPYELLIAVRLSAQCTDARVNQITPKLFAAYPTLESLAAADIGDLEEIVRPCGFYHMVQELSHGGILSLPKRVRASSATVGRGNVAECTENLLENELHFVKIFQNLLTSRVVRAILVIVYFDEKAVSQWAFLVKYSVRTVPVNWHVLNR